MYCPKCGKEVGTEAKFCPNCGTQIPSFGGFTVKESDTPVLRIKPVFIPSVTILSGIPIQIFLTIWGGMFFGGFGMFGARALGIDMPPWFTFVFFGCLFFFGTPIFIYLSKKKNYEKTEYRFYNTKLEYYEGFFNIEEKTISYKNITEVYLSKSVFQRPYGLGTIILSTPATGYSSRGQVHSGIRIEDIKNPDEVYRQVKELIGRYS